MENKKTINIRLSTLFLILAIIVIIAMGYYIYIDKTNANKEITELKTTVNNMQNTINSLKEEITENMEKNNNNSNDTTTTVSDNNQTVSGDNVSFTEEQVETTLSDFLELRVHANCDTLLEILTKKGILNYNPANDTILDDGTVLTTIKFSDYKNAMLNYVSETEFEKNWDSSLYFSTNDNGYLIKTQGGGGLNRYTIKNITKNSNLSYSAKIVYTTENNNTYDEDVTFTVTSYNGNCVIDSIE